VPVQDAEKKVAIVGRGKDAHCVYDLAHVSFEQRKDYARQMLVSTGSVPICGHRSSVLFSTEATPGLGLEIA
jgi:hypothetical protein